MASLRKKSGRYYARFYDSDRSPKQKEIALRTSRKSNARKRLVEWEEAYEEGEFDPWRGGWLRENIPVPEAIERFLKDKRKDGLQESTVEAYEYKLNAFEKYTHPSVMTRHDLTGPIRDYIHAPINEGEKDERDTSNATKRSRYRHLRAFFSWCVDEGLADENPVEDVSRPRKEEKTKAFLRPEEVEKILRTIDAHREMRKGQPGPTPEDSWLKEMIRVAVGTGLRRGELLNLQWRDVDLDNARIVVRNRDEFTTKGGSERTVPLAGGALDTLKQMHEDRSTLDNKPVFVDADGDPPKPDRVSKRFKFYVRKAKLQNREELSFHSCRHTTGSWLSMQGVPLRVISEILGHSNTQVTEMYSHLSPEVMDRAMKETFGEN